MVVALADVNGNGSEDVVWSSPRGMWGLDLAGVTSAGMLVAIDNGLGQSQEFVYKSSAQIGFEAADVEEPWDTSIPVSIPVAVRTTLVLASGDPERTSELTVRNPAYDYGDREFVGFAESIRTTLGPSPADTRA